MKIAWTRLTQTVDLHPNNITQGFGEIRIEIMHELIKRGHEITITACMNNPSEKMLKEIKDGKVTKVRGINVAWMKALKYKPFATPSKNDVLFIEHGAVNLMFGGKYIDCLPLFKTREQVKAHKGLVIFLNADPDLPTPIHKLAGSQCEWSHPKNIFRKETKDNTWSDGKYNFKNHKNIEEQGWGDWEDMFTKGKTIVVAPQALDSQKIIDTEHGGARGRWWKYAKKGLINIECLPTAYPENLLKKYKFNENPEYDIAYTGYPRNREPSFKDLWWDMPRKLKMVTTGPWSAKKQDNMLPNTNHQCLGLLKGLKEVPTVCNNSKAVLQLGVRRAKLSDFVTNRHLEVVFSKTVCMYDAGYGAMEKYLGKEFALLGHDDALKKYMTISKASAEQRYHLWRYQYELCKNYNIEWYTTQFELLCKKYGVKVKPKKFKFAEPSFDKDIKQSLKCFNKTVGKIKVSKYKISKRRKRDE